MNRNERVAQVMGWEYDNSDPDCGEVLRAHGGVPMFPAEDVYDAKELQRRMVEDGWWLRMVMDKSGCSFQAERGDEYFWTKPFGPNDEPAAIFDLFCKVYAIDGAADDLDEMEDE